MTIKKLDELNADNIKDLSAEELQELALAGKDELIGARGVIGDLNKKIKSSDGGSEGDESSPMTKEELENHLSQREKDKAMDNFIAQNPAFEDYKDDLEKASATGLFDNLDEASKFLVEKNPTLQNNLKTNQAGVGGGTQTGSENFSQKMSFADYNQLSADEQKAYDQACQEKYGGVTYSDTFNPDE